MTRTMTTLTCDSPSSIAGAFRRRTMAAGDALLRDRSKSGDTGDGDSRRRQSYAAGDFELNDWEEERLDIEGFVSDYFAHRALQDGLEWYDAPELPFGVQPEHLMMRDICAIFERRNRHEFESFAEQLFSIPKLTFSLYSEVVQMIGWTGDESCAMSYGRLIGLISFGGLMASRMLAANHSEQVRNMSLYTALFIKSRIKTSWKNDERSWAGFMALSETMKARDDVSRQKKLDEEQRRARNRRWSMIGLGTVAAALGVGVAVVGGRILLNHK
ncbi:unnamed protein product [Caenorhabditis auriculariae]|uniref:Apoptosis regulator Bcl-2 family BH4 domain-containing protein n=1 Tax=Caenorhabditis auriculariae TaxID=2777116 RepID=A0A8S1H4G2_9PELO|nr:unnamed protein product [Caenorhabditis auriculariae]